MSNNSGMNLLDTLTVLSTILQLYNYEAELRSADNDDIMRELQKQDREYFDKILQNQELIMQKLDSLDL